jgi:drug/metabolite transporter (DMT)-like permease
MKNAFGIVGSLLFVAAVIVGYFCKFDSADLVAVALDAFALATLLVGIIKKYKEAGKFSWKLVVTLVMTVVGAVLVALGGLSDNIFATLAGAVVGILAVIFGVFAVKKA